ncbi:MAG TPA: zf-TFIIB domain-containing protein [Polyangiaceae bacterium]
MIEGQSSYRDQPARCPSCDVTMEQKSLFDATIDECATCHGVWVDWFDGELERVVHDLPPEPAPLRARAHAGTNTCPRCQSVLQKEERTPGGDVWRCGECGGAFVPRSSFEPLLAAVTSGPPSAPEPSKSISARLLAVLQSLLSGKH